MGGQIRTENPAMTAAGEVLPLLLREPWLFGLYQSVRLLERALPDRSPVGHYADVTSEAVRFLQHPSLVFPASEIQALRRAPGKPVELTVNTASFVGPLGVLPVHYTELVIDRLRARDHTFFDFLNLFHHRITSQFYRAWRKHRLAIGYETDRNDPVTSRLYDLTGLGTDSLRNRQPIPDTVMAFYSGFFSSVVRSHAVLESLLADYFNVPVQVEQFVGVWRKLDEADQCCFAFESESVELGGGAVAGDEVWDVGSRARIVIGPLTASRYREFLPEGSAFAPLRALTRMFTGNDVDYELQLILKREQVPRCELGADERAGIQLGWFTWMRSGSSFDRNPGDTILLLA